jgi:hypothetical protein
MRDAKQRLKTLQSNIEAAIRTAELGSPHFITLMMLKEMAEIVASVANGSEG